MGEGERGGGKGDSVCVSRRLSTNVLSCCDLHAGENSAEQERVGCPDYTAWVSRVFSGLENIILLAVVYRDVCGIYNIIVVCNAKIIHVRACAWYIRLVCRCI